MEEYKIKVSFDTFLKLQDMKKILNDKLKYGKELNILTEDEIINYSLRIIKSIYDTKF
jgi:hypothetical protein